MWKIDTNVVRTLNIWGAHMARVLSPVGFIGLFQGGGRLCGLASQRAHEAGALSTRICARGEACSWRLVENGRGARFASLSSRVKK